MTCRCCDVLQLPSKFTTLIKNFNFLCVSGHLSVLSEVCSVLKMDIDLATISTYSKLHIFKHVTLYVHS